MHHTFETHFAQNLLASVPPTASKRFAVYRNNVFVSLVEALKARFPAVRNAVGTEFFSALARDYAGSNMPVSPLMMQYGDSFPDFIETFPPLADYPWISDLARVECAITQSYHASDAPLLGAEAFAAIAPEQLGELKITLHPALKLVQSSFPIATLWQMNSGRVAVSPLDDIPAETALIQRPHFTVSVKGISTSGGAFLNALKGGHTLSQAADLAVAIDATFDLTAHLHLLIADGLITALALEVPHRSPS
jgi:hypothetical protein